MDHISRWRMHANPEVAALLVSELGTHFERLDTVLTRLVTHPSCAQGLPEVEAVRRALDLGVPKLSRLPADTVIGLVARHFNLRPSDLRSATRSPRVATPRQIAIYLVRRYCRLSYPDIAQRFRRHHTTAIHSCRQIQRQREQNAGVRAALTLLEKELHKLGESSG